MKKSVLVGTVVPPPVWSSIELMFGEKRIQFPPPPPPPTQWSPHVSWHKGAFCGWGAGG